MFTYLILFYKGGDAKTRFSPQNDAAERRCEQN